MLINRILSITARGNITWTNNVQHILPGTSQTDSDRRSACLITLYIQISST